MSDMPKKLNADELRQVALLISREREDVRQAVKRNGYSAQEAEDESEKLFGNVQRLVLRYEALEALLGEVAAKLASGADFIRRMDDYQCHNTTCYAVSSGGGGGRCTCGVKALGEAAILFAKDAESLAVRLRAAVEG